MANLRIVAVADNINFDLFALEQYGLGGSESALLNLCFEFANLGHSVIVYGGSVENKDYIKSHTYNNVAFHDIKLLKDITILGDIFIGLRSCKIFLDYDLSNIKLKIFWSQDTRYHASTEHLFSNSHNVLNNIDKIVVISDYSYNQFKDEKLDFITNKLVKIQNGYNSNFIINKSNIKNKNNINFVYTSTPYRGLIYLIDMWPKIVNNSNKNIVLHLFTGMELYGNYGHDDTNAYIYNRISRYNNIVLHKPICQKNLFKELSNIDIMLYPNEYPEAGCMALKEAMASSCTSVVSNLGALKEKVIDNQNGYLIFGHPANEKYQENFIDMTLDLVTNDSKLKQFQNNAQETVKDWTWKNRALEWINLL